MSIFTWLFVGVIILGVIAYANPQLWEDVKWKITEGKDIVESKVGDIETQGVIEPAKKTDTLVSKCKKSFNDCKDIYYKKMALSVSISEIQEVNSMDEAEEFYNIWSSRLEDWDKMGEENRQRKINEGGFPQVLIAYSVKWPDKDFKVPSIAICNEEGELTQASKGALSCG
tara:strand:- start:160 stop:672 length:513 start_codon:yes stop_codon:yes gene_type:complete